MAATSTFLRNIPLTELRQLTGICSTAQRLVPKRLEQLDKYQQLDVVDRIVQAVHNGDLDIANEATENLTPFDLDKLVDESLTDLPLLGYLLHAPNMPSTLSVSLFQAAAMQNKLPAVKRLVSARVRGINSALVAAAEANHMSIVKFLVEHNAVATEVAAAATDNEEIQQYLQENMSGDEDREQLLIIAIEQHPEVDIGMLEDLVERFYEDGEDIADIPESISEELQQ